MHFVFGSITTALLRPVCPGRPRRSGKKGQSERKKGKWRLGRGTQRGQMESGKRPCKVKQEWDKNTSVFLMPRICDKERERTKRLFGARLLNSICVSVFFFIEPVSALLQFRKICRKAGQYFSSLSLSFLLTALLSSVSSLLTHDLLRTLACTFVRWQDFGLRRSGNLWKSFEANTFFFFFETDSVFRRTDKMNYSG